MMELLVIPSWQVMTRADNDFAGYLRPLTAGFIKV